MHGATVKIVGIYCIITVMLSQLLQNLNSPAELLAECSSVPHS